MYLACLRFFLISLNASHSFNNVLLQNIGSIIEVMICTSIH